MANATAGGAQAIPHQGAFDASAIKDIQDTTCNGAFTVLSGAADQVPFPGNVEVNTAGVDAMLLNQPIAGPQPLGDDGKSILIISNTANAHTITCAANGIINAKHLLTFAANKGSAIELIAMAGLWVPTLNVGITVS